MGRIDLSISQLVEFVEEGPLDGAELSKPKRQELPLKNQGGETGLDTILLS